MLAPLLAPRRSRFDLYLQRQIRLWCNRVLEGRGFTQLFAEQAANHLLIEVPSTVFAKQAYAAVHGLNARPDHFGFGGPNSNSSGGSGNGFFAGSSAPSSVFHPLPPSSSSGSQWQASADAFYIELLVFDPAFVQQCAALAYTYVWSDARDEFKRKEKEKQQLLLGPPPPPGSRSSSGVAATSSGVSPLFPLVARNMSRAASTPIDLGPLRARENLALLCAELAALLSSDHVAAFLARSEAFWQFVVEHSLWELLALMYQDRPAREVKDRLLLQGAVEPMLQAQARRTSSGASSSSPSSSSSESPSVLAMLLSLASRKSSSYFRLLLELGAHGTFPNVFNEQNVSHVLSLLRLVCSWQVHEIMRRYEQIAAANASSSSSSTAPPSVPLSSQADFYACLTAPFTFWGIVHSLSVVAPLRQQYLGALHWFLSPRNLAMQVEIWKVVKEALYGEELEIEDSADDKQQQRKQQSHQQPRNGQVPAPSPLHAPGAVGGSSPFHQQRLRERRLRSLSQIAKSAHNSGILQAIFTFPLATAHFYSVWASEMLWPTRRLSIDAYFPSAAATATNSSGQPAVPAKMVGPSESVTDLLIAQLGALLHTGARVASEHGFLHIPAIRSACLEGVQLALVETEAFGSGAMQRATEQAQAERAAARQARKEAKAARARELAQAQAEAIRLEEQAKAEKLLARSNRKRSSRRANATVPAPPPVTVSPAAELSSQPEAPDMFSSSRSLRLSSSSPTTTRAMARAQREMQKLLPADSTTPVAAATQPQPRGEAPQIIVSAPSLDSLRPVSVEDDVRVDELKGREAQGSNGSADATSAATTSASSSPSSSDDAVTLPPPFSFELNDAAVDEDDDERANERQARQTKRAAAMAAAASSASGPLHKLPTPADLDFAMDAKRILSEATDPSSSPSPPTTPPAATAAAVPQLPSLPQRHRLLYSFFQLLLAQPIVKLVVTSPSLWEMLSDVGFLELLTVALFGPTGAEAAIDSETAAAASTSRTAGATNGPFRNARALLSSKRDSLHAWQRLVAHWRLALFLADLRERHFEVALAEAMSNVLTWLASDKGRALILAVMDGLAERDATNPAAAAGGQANGVPSSSLSARFQSLTQLLTHRSTVSLLTSPRFWLLFADMELLRYFSQGQFLRLWLHGHKQLREMQLHVPVWSLLKQQGAKTVTAVRMQAATKLANQAQKLAGPSSPSFARTNGGGGEPEWEQDDLLNGGASASQNKRSKLRGFVKAKLSDAAATAAARLAQPSARQTAAAAARTRTEAQSSDSGPSDSAALEEDAQGAASAGQTAPVGVAALLQFFTLVSKLYELLSGTTARNDRIRAAL
jgi:hypothetical protein